MDVVDRLNANPVTEYAVYIPETGCYVTKSDGETVRVFATTEAADWCARSEHPGVRFHIHSRLNYAVTPWRKVAS